MNNLWEIANESRKSILHPRLAALINQRHCLRVLDYGCGDGSLMKRLRKEIEVSIFDTNQTVLELAKRNLAEYRTHVYPEASAIPQNYFDIIVCSLVLMEISSKEEIMDILNGFYANLVNGGEVFIAITHPCFRQYAFSTFSTSYSKGDSFQYFNEGTTFQVFVKDEQNSSSSSFYDYHWTLSTTTSLILKAKFQLSEIIELEDMAQRSYYYNEFFSPYMILRAVKDRI